MTNDNSNNNNPTDNLNLTKRKREISTTSRTTIHQSFSQLSISQPSHKKKCRLPKTKKEKKRKQNKSKKKKKKKKNNNNITTKKNKNKKKTSEDNQSVKLSYDYLQIPDPTFKEMLSTASQEADKVVQSLMTNEQVQFARRCATVYGT
jgi:hypothetical protein